MLDIAAFVHDHYPCNYTWDLIGVPLHVHTVQSNSSIKHGTEGVNARVYGWKLQIIFLCNISWLLRQAN